MPEARVGYIHAAQPQVYSRLACTFSVIIKAINLLGNLFINTGYYRDELVILCLWYKAKLISWYR